MCYFENRSNTEKIPKPIQQPHRKETEEMSIDRIQHVGTTDTIEEVTKFNPYHGSDGRFASAGGGGSAAAGTSPFKAGNAHEVLAGMGKKSKVIITTDKCTRRYEKADTSDRLSAEWTFTNSSGQLCTISAGNLGDIINRGGNGVVGKIQNIRAENNVGKSIDTIEHVEKFNPYHGRDGRFSSADGAASFTYAPGKSKAHDMAIAREKERYAATTSAGSAGSAGSGEKNETKSNQEQIDRVKRFEEELISELQSNIQPQYRDEFNTIHDLLNDDTMERDIQRVKTSVENNDKEEMKRLRNEFKSTADDYASPWFDDDLGYMREGYEWESNFYNKLADLCKSYQPMAKNYDHIEHTGK